MRGVSPIVSTILMVAIAIAAAVVVYYITMDVITKQGAQLQEQTLENAPSIRIEAASIEVNGQSFEVNDENDKMTIYYTILNSDVKNVKDIGKPSVYILYENNQAVVCTLSGNELNTAVSGKIEKNTIATSSTSCALDINDYYYIKVTAGTAVSNLYKVRPSKSSSSGTAET